MFSKFYTKPIDQKKKTGDVEQLEIIWVAYQSLQSYTGKSASLSRKDFSREYVQKLSTEQEEHSSVLHEMFSIASKFNYGSVSKLREKVPGVIEIRDWLATVYEVLGDDYRQFVVNLAMFDFKTAGGGRARKSTSVLRKGTEEYTYARPFVEYLPYFVSALLSVVPKKNSISMDLREVVTFKPRGGGAYVPPTRFTATFPLTLGRLPSDGKKTLIAPHVPSKAFSSEPPIKYAYIGSFGFSEPSYSEWTDEEGEYPGTRLSLGAYSLNPTYLKHLQVVMDAMDTEARAGYEKYGGVGEKHVLALMEKFGESKGLGLAVAWVQELVGVARALVAAAMSKEASKLGEFFLFILEKIKKREVKLDEIKELISNPQVFEYVWVFESTLWEFAFLGASCLSAEEVREILGTLEPLKTWEPSVGFSKAYANDVRESVVVKLDESAFSFERIYFPSGTGAAKELHDVLLERDFRPHPFKLNRDKLSTFTPYFEFYLSEESFLNEKVVFEHPSMAKVQLWLNLSDGLHSELLGREAGEAGAVLARMLIPCIKEYVPELPVCLVIDYTKFTGDMPNSSLYPILAVMVAVLKGKVTNLKRVVLLRSNLKYNTGGLERYQSGEILLPRDPSSTKMSSGLADELSKRAAKAFAGTDMDEPRLGDWSMRGEYVSLMRKLYLLSDAITFGRWKEYAQLWK